MSLQGSQKLAILLCKFSDSAETEPHSVSYYKDLFTKRGTGGLNDYWAAASLGAINLDGSQVFGWKTFNINRADFIANNPGRWDKIKGAIDQFTNVDTSKFAGVVALFNVDVTDGGEEGGVLGQPQDANVTFRGHETGHLFGLDHAFDMSSRIAMPQWPSAPGEYYDLYDIMGASNGRHDTGHRFSPRGPHLNVASLDRMGWLPANRVWQPKQHSSGFYEIDIVALEHPEVSGYLAARSGGWMAEFRMPNGFDGGLKPPAVLFHNESANPNSYIIASDPVNHVNEWQPGQVYWNPTIFTQLGGTRVTVVNFNLQKKTARLHVQVKAAKYPFVPVEVIFGLGIGQVPSSGGFILVLKDGKLIPIPVPGPEPISPDLRDITRGHVVDILKDVLSFDMRDAAKDINNDQFN